MAGTTKSAGTSFGSLDRSIKRIAVVIVLGSLMSIIDTTIVNVALDSLSKDLNASLSQIQWVVSAYLLALAAVIPLTAWAIRRYSAFRVYMMALILFTLGSALCGMAGTVQELIAFRVLQGVGGGMLVPTGLTILVRATGPTNLPTVMSAIGVPMVLAPVFGPTIGGFLLQAVSWHAIFLINVPLGIATGFVARRLLPHDRPDDDPGRLDWLGLVLAASGTVGITYGLSQSASTGSLTSPLVVWPIVLGIILVGLFVLRSRMISYPLLDLTLYRIRAYSAATLVMFCLGAAMFGAMILLPLYFQLARGEDAVMTGIMLIPQGVGGSIGMNRSARATHRFGAGITSVCGGILMLLATIPFLFISATTPYALIAVMMVFRGIGVGLAVMPAMTAAFGALDHDQVNDASPQLNIVQRVGGTFGTAVIAAALQDQLTHLAQPATPSATAAAFAHTYWFVVGMTLISMVPAVMLWRIERRTRATGEEAGLSDPMTIEALA